MDGDIRAVPHAPCGRQELTSAEALAYLRQEGDAAEADALMAAARRYPNSVEYTAGRRRYAVYVMPGGYWRAGNCEAIEARIRAAAGMRRW